MIAHAYRMLAVQGHDLLLCLLCDRTSAHPQDREQRYCGFCQAFLENIPMDFHPHPVTRIGPQPSQVRLRFPQGTTPHGGLSGALPLPSPVQRKDQTMPQSQPMPDRPADLDAILDPADVARLLHAAMAYLATAFYLLQCEAGTEARYAAQAHIYLAREEIEAALAAEVTP